MTETALISFKNGKELVDHFYTKSFKLHPLFQDKKNYDLTHLWSVVAIGKPYKHMDPIWISQVCGRIEDEELRCLLIADIDDDLGHGDYAKRQELVLEKVADALKPWAKENQIAMLEKESIEFAKRLNVIKTDKDVRIALGAIMVGYLYGEVIIDFIKETINNNKEELAKTQLHWFHGHEDMDHDHRDETLKIAYHIAEHTDDLNKIAKGAKQAEKVYWDTFGKLTKI